MKRYIFIVMALAMIVGALPASAGQPRSFTFDGAGWGHGVGFSQWGARGQALEDPGKVGEDIAAYYYPGSEPGGLSELDLENDLLDTLETPIWVNLESEVTILEFTAIGGSLDLCLSEHGTCPKPEQPQSGETWEFRRMAVGVCGFFKDDVQQGSSGECHASITWPNADGVRLRDLTNAPRICATSGSSVCEYHRGEIRLRDDPTEVGFHVVLAIGLDDFIKGIREIPDDWTSEGVNEAQAVAARSYGAYKFFANEDASKRNQADLNADPGITDSRKDSCWCHIYDDTADMQYVAWDRETDAPHWVTAVTATTDRVVTYLGPSWEAYTQEGIVQAFFSASSGGWTNTNVLGFGTRWDGVDPGNSQWPYLTTVADPWAIDPQWGNPNASWSEDIDATTIAALLGWDGVTDATLIDGPPEPTIQFDGIDGGAAVSTTVTGRWIRITLGLQSSMVTAIDGESPDPPSPPGPFDDIAGSGHSAAILAIFDAGITLGCTETSYCPLDDVTRAQMATFIARALDLPDPVADYFSDDDGTTHEPAINQLYEAGITLGCGPSLFCPNDPVMRNHMAALMARSLNLTTESGDYFTDDDGSQFEPYINAIADAGITLGCDDDRFCPFGTVTRAQMASFLERAYLPET